MKFSSNQQSQRCYFEKINKIKTAKSDKEKREDDKYSTSGMKKGYFY